MNWEAIGAVGEILGALTVVVTLVYLAVQVRQNTAAVKASSHHAITDSFNAINARIAENPQMARIWRLGQAGLGTLSEDETVSFSFMMLAYLRVFETLYYQRKIGTMEEQLFVAEEQTLRWAVRSQGFREFWTANPISLSAEFRDYIGKLIEETPVAASS